MARPDPQVLAHQEWLGFVRPTAPPASAPPPGLVVSAPALVRAGVILDRRDAEGQRLLRGCVEERVLAPGSEPQPIIADFAEFARRVLAWSFSARDYAGGDGGPIPPELEVALPEYGETLRPDFAVREPEPADGAQPWQLLVRVLDPSEDLDREVRGSGRLEASAHGRMERLLRATGVSAGLLCNGRVLRLVSAPRGESSGWLEFRVADMAQTAGRPISTALRALLQASRLLTLPREQRLAALLEASRRFQNEVSERLAVQVLEALYELLRGFQAAHDASGRELLSQPLTERPDEVYRALLTVILRLVFLLYAEEREMLPEDETFLQYYSLAGLHQRLRDDDAQYPDTMDQRYGAWAQLLALFRMVHDGADVGGASMPPRHGALFDPDRFPFLEGRRWTDVRQVGERIQPPLVPDGTVYRALEKLLVLDGERISYRALDVEQIGSVYETMMGFSLEVARGRSLAVKAQSRYGASTTIDLEALLEIEPGKRAKWLKDRTGRDFTKTNVGQAVSGARTIEELHAALLRVTDTAATPELVPAGAMVMQPSEERRHSGSHYTPRELTEPIVRTTLAPILDGLRGADGKPPRPEQILELKVCDPAMGSGAFLVEVCRQLGDALIDAWAAHGGRPEIPLDEVETVFAQRLVAQRCLYGVDRNPMAVDLAKMSLWLATLAREHPLTFIDHALRHGDSLVGLTRRQLQSFHWKSSASGFEAIRIDEHLARAAELRAEIREAGEDIPDSALRDMWDEVQTEMVQVRLFGDLVVAAFFLGAKNAEREAKRREFADAVGEGRAEPYRGLLEEMREAEPPLVPFHWELELPEVFARERPGFDAMVGNPPFMGGHKIWSVLGGPYRDYLKLQHPESGGKAVDLVAHFYRQCFTLIREEGTSGLVATNTIAQGDTRFAGLRYICRSGGTIYSARRRLQWPGNAVVVVSVVHVLKGHGDSALLDGESVEGINSFLFASQRDFDPQPLRCNAGRSFRGSMVYGMGFTFDDSSEQATPLRAMNEMISQDAKNKSRIFPFVSGHDITTEPSQGSNRFIIDFEEMTLPQAENWPELLRIVREKVKPERDVLGGYAVADRRREYWWQYGSYAAALHASLRSVSRCLVLSQVSQYLALCFMPTERVFSHGVIVFPLEGSSSFSVLQSRTHELWARFFGSSLKDDLRYTPSDCFETFPFPENWESDPALETAGETYYNFRAALMKRNDEGLTKTYNRFHDPYEHDPDIEKLRALHTEMDRAVLHAYDWDDIPTNCEFLLDYAIDEEEWGKKKKPYRYRWPDDVRDEVLARLIGLNAERAAAEQRSGAAAAGRKCRGAAAGRRSKVAQAEELF